MAGRPHKIRSIKSYITNVDTHSGLSMLKAGTPNKIGMTHYLWYNVQTQSNPGPLDYVLNQAYYNTKQWQTFGNLRPSFVPSPRHAYVNYYV